MRSSSRVGIAVGAVAIVVTGSALADALGKVNWSALAPPRAASPRQDAPAEETKTEKFVACTKPETVVVTPGNPQTIEPPIAPGVFTTQRLDSVAARRTRSNGEVIMYPDSGKGPIHLKTVSNWDKYEILRDTTLRIRTQWCGK